MVLRAVLCPYCGSDNVRKNGHYESSKQRYLCKNDECTHATFVESYTYKAHDRKVKEAILTHIVNGTGTRATARILGISRNTVSNTLKKTKQT